jgi:hypothetical protein
MKHENGPLIALIFFMALSATFGVFAYQKRQEVIGEDPLNPLMEANIKEQQEKIEANEKTIREAREETAKYVASIHEQHVRYMIAANERVDFQSEIKRRKGLNDIGEKIAVQATTQGSAITEKIAERLAEIKREREKEENDAQAQIDKLNAKKEEALTRIRTAKDQLVAAEGHHRKTKDYAQAELDESKSVLSDLTQRDVERASVLTEADGEVLVADVLTNRAFINLGTAAGVKNGYRFECYAMRAGNQKVRKGFLEVVSAGPGKSECVVVRRLVDLPRDPLSGYVASEPEEMYSPYQEHAEPGKKGASVQRLSDGKTVLSGPSALDPIVEGDLIQNPFFKPNKTFTYYIAGAKKIENENQRSAIRYRWTEIKAVIEKYGGKVSPVADSAVDFVIAQKNPASDGTDEEKADYKKAVDLGLPVIYEWELFRFLDGK